jgi:4-amino-4-deoxy-L-arabinose transferase-like glycosyltransferase
MLKRSIGKINLRQTALQAGILGAFLLALFFGFAGVDYGPQWDQNLIKGHVNQYIRTGNFLPGEYIYPPVSTYIATSTLIPYAIPFVLRYGTNWFPTQQYLLNEVLKNPNDAFLWNLRRVFVFFTLLAVVWVGIAAGQRDWLAGLVAAGALAFSWEISYHSRLIHPDGPAMQFGSLALMFSFLAFYKKKPFNYAVWLGLAAAAAALATASKYTSGIFLIAVMVFAFGIFKAEGYKLGKVIISLFGILLIFGVVFILLVPGVFLEQPIFIQHLLYTQSVYAHGHGMHTVQAGFDYFERVMQYLFLAAFSYNPFLAVLIPSLAILGVYSLLKHGNERSPYLALALGGVPFLYILFLSTNRALIVRNLLIVLPSIAILAGFGFTFLLRILKPYAIGWRLLPIGALLLVLGWNLQWISYTAWTIRMRNSDVFASQAIQAIREHPDEWVYVTPSALKLLGNEDLPANASSRFSGNEDLVLFAYLGDARDEDEGYWPINFYGASPMIFGPQDINMDWYTSWPGVERLVLSTPKLAWQDGSPLGKHPNRDSSSLIVEYRGILYLDGEQFYVNDEKGKRVYILNSANPKLLLSLRSLVEEEVTLKAVQYSAERDHDWFILSVNGNEIIPANQAVLEFHTIRFLSNLNGNQLDCVAETVGSAKFKSMTENMLPMIDLSDEELVSAADCISE